ncbi:MAG: Uma2 family endonuclease [Hydrogenophilaceae bacterium]|jgi:Uma2 family endonuclease|nr:Uma2 family endonuclease [Hydrogenophilaceae bacterium]
MADDVRPNHSPNLRTQEATDFPAREKRLTVAEFDRMAEAGLLNEPGKHELWDGRIMMTPPPGAPHMDAESRINEALVLGIAQAGLRAQFRVVPGGGLQIGECDLRQPDLMVVRLPINRERRPSGDGVVLVIEVAHSSLPDDLGEKRGKYAAAGVAEYWVVDVQHALLHVFRGPHAGDYPPAQQLAAEASVSPLFAPGLSFAVADLV